MVNKFPENLSTMLGVKNVIAGFQSLFSGTGKLSHDADNQINRGDYGSGYTAFRFDLSPDHYSGEHFELIKQGNLRAELHFQQALANTVNLIIHAEFQNMIIWRKPKRSLWLDKLEWIPYSWLLFWEKIDIRAVCFKEYILAGARVHLARSSRKSWFFLSRCAILNWRNLIWFTFFILSWRKRPKFPRGKSWSSTESRSLLLVWDHIISTHKAF